jgi:hypothetical protein
MLQIAISTLFSLRNVLGILACYYSWRSIWLLRQEADEITAAWMKSFSEHVPTRSDAGLFPRPILGYAFLATGLSLVLNLIAWIVLPVLKL